MDTLKPWLAPLPLAPRYDTPLLVRSLPTSLGGVSGEALQAQRVRIVTLRRFQVWLAPEDNTGQLQRATFATRQAEALLKCLLVAPKGRASREQLTEQLWPAFDAEQAREALSHALSRLRRALDPLRVAHEAPRCLLSDRELIWLRRPQEGDVHEVPWIDFLAFQSLAASALDALAATSMLGDTGCRDHLTTGWHVGQQALALYGGPFLPTDRSLPWTEPIRAHLEALWAILVRRLGEVALHAGWLEHAIAYYQQLVEALPDEEGATMRLMIALAVAGRRGEALRTYQALRDRLAVEHEMQPTSELQRLVEGIRSATSQQELLLLLHHSPLSG